VLGELEHAQNQFNVPAPEANRERLLEIPLRVPRKFNAMRFTKRFELETSVETAHFEERGVETTKVIVDALRPIAESLVCVQVPFQFLNLDRNHLTSYP
jgi:hypothetical protein